MKNERILELLEDKIFTIIELEDLGFKDFSIIKSDSINENSLIGKITYHDVNEYEGYTLLIDDSEKATVKKTI